MSNLYLPVRTKGSAAIAICGRCQQKMYHSDLKKDPNNEQWYCAECIDEYDPWRLPARNPENINLDVPPPRSDVELV